MRKRIPLGKLLPVYALVLIGCICAAYYGSRAVTTMVESAPLEGRTCIIIDAGHGGMDGGATSCSGVLESSINLEIAIRLNDLLHLLGYDTKMIRTTDTSIYTEGNTIASQKVSDLKNRVNIVNSTPNAVLVSIHQNTYPDGRFCGAQVFYADDNASRDLAIRLQSGFINTVNPGSNRKCKPSDGIYLMQQIRQPGVLIECGFISNAEEDARLKTAQYQKQVVCVIGSCLSLWAEQ